MLNAETYLNRRCDDSARQGRGTEDCRGIDTGHGPQLAHPHCRNGSHPSTKGSLFGVFMEEHFRINCVGPVMFVMEMFPVLYQAAEYKSGVLPYMSASKAAVLHISP
ncbi:UNVERIFIED_CONTAM: hypothetical protein NCL1_55482 [Trichonephila clavipes]